MATITLKGYAKKIWRATLYSYAGLKAVWLHQWAFRIEIAICIVATPLALILGKTGTQRALLLSSLLIILIVETLNSAIETTINRIGLEYNPLAGQAKDLGSFAVLLAGVNAAVVWALVIFG
jgi:diacylglycerol kinase (ATP)